MNIVNPDLIADIEHCLGIAARVVARDITALPIFERLDAELTKARATVSIQHMDDPIAKARELSRVKRIAA